MKVVKKVIYVAMASFCLNLTVSSQNITLKMSNITVKQAMDELKSRSGYSFVFSSADVDTGKKISVSSENQSINAVIEQILRGQGLTYEIQGKNIILKKDILTSVDKKTKITGIVKDQYGEPIIGANVVVKGTTVGTITDIDGNYTLDVPSGASLQVSYIGYLTQDVVTAGKNNIDINLIEDTQKLEEVVVVGYGTQKKVTVTGSVASVSGEELKASPTTNLTNGMVGRMPGVIGFQTADEPGGGGTTIRIRGTNSLGSNDPLVVIDGVPDRDGGMNRLNPTEIESISVLKDASAAIYGARAANGVILITTKRGKEGKPVVSFNASAGFSQPTRLPKMTNSYEYATMLNEVLPGSFSDEQLEGFRTHANPWKYPDTDWFDEIVKGASPLYRADIGVSGGTEKVKYYANFGANGEDGLYRNSANRYDQYSLRTNLDVKTSKYVDFQLGVTARLEDTKYPAKGAGDIFGAARRSRPDQVAWWPSGEPGPAVERGDNPAVTSTDLAGFDHYKNQYIQNNLSVNIKVPWIEGLTLRGNGSYDIHFQNRRLMKKPVYLYTWDGTTEGSEGLSASKQWLDTPQLERKHSEQIGWMLNGLIDYNRTFGQQVLLSVWKDRKSNMKKHGHSVKVSSPIPNRN